MGKPKPPAITVAVAYVVLANNDPATLVSHALSGRVGMLLYVNVIRLGTLRIHNLPSSATMVTD